MHLPLLWLDGLKDSYDFQEEKKDRRPQVGAILIYIMLKIMASPTSVKNFSNQTD